MPLDLTRRQFAALPLAAAAQNSRRLNVLMIAVDDLNNRLGCYGDPIVKSPNIDRLASRGVRFDRAYCQYPLCNPSRTSLLSGRRPDTTQVLDNRTPPRTHLGDVAFLPEYFKQHGYFTGRIGKIAHGLYEDAVRWDVSEQSRGRRERGAVKAAKKAKAETKAGAPPAEGGGGLKLEWIATGNADADEPDGNTAVRIVKLMEEKRDRPFFLGAGFHKPHLPWVAPKKYFDMYPAGKIALPKTPATDRDDIPPVALTRTRGDESMSDLERRQAIAAYHACTTFTDAQIGMLLGALDRLKLWDSTVVLFFGDHGWHLNDHLGLWRKMTVFEESARAPLIVAAPGFKPGVASPRLVEFVDFYPTLAELCGLPAPQGLEGTSMVPLLRDPQRKWKSAAFTTVARGRGILGRSVRTGRYRYTEWGPNTAELYDHERDIHEFTNLANDPKSAKVHEELRQLLQKGWRAALPPA
ncbi:MAG: sulfatase [Bryobacteraceae bacterium]